MAVLPESRGRGVDERDLVLFRSWYLGGVVILPPERELSGPIMIGGCRRVGGGDGGGGGGGGGGSLREGCDCGGREDGIEGPG